MLRRLFSATIVSSLLLIAASPANADHANSRRWKATTASTTEVTVVDRTGSAAWQEATQKAVASWNAANTSLRLTWTTGTGACNFEAHKINVCMAYANGYDGMANWRYDSTGYLSGATVSFDPQRTSNYSTFNMRALACHEIGHNLVLNHTPDTGSCMSTPVYVAVPNTHDYDALRSTYGTYSTSTTPTTTAEPTTTTTTTTTTTAPPKKCRRLCR